MADHGHSSGPVLTGMAAHRATYEGFLNWSVAISLICFFICVALVAARFTDSPISLVGSLGGVLLGVVTSVIGLRMGGKWILPIAALILYGLFIGMNVHNS